MGQQAVGNLPRIYIPPAFDWHTRPYGDKAACWGCGLEPDRKINRFPYGPVSICPGGTGRPTIPACEWCRDLTALLLAVHHRAYQRRIRR